jgi:CRP-like cAMP-binding protein
LRIPVARRNNPLPNAKNHLIERLPRKDREHLLALCEVIELPFEQVLWQRGKPARHVYFPTTAFISLVASLDDKPVLEVGMAGHEGVLGAQLALGVTNAPLHAVVQGAGTAWRIGAVSFRREVGRSPPLRRSLDGYLSVLMSQLGTSAACVRFHLIGPRLARWLLMTHDRAQSDTFNITHQFLSYMLGVRRVGITAAAGALQDRGLISYRRGILSVLDRRGLEGAACSCYASDRKCYAELLH